MFGLCVWFVYLVCVFGLCVWFVCLVCVFGLCVWFVYLVLKGNDMKIMLQSNAIKN